MSDKATVKIGSEFDSSGITKAKKELGEVQDAAAKTGEANTSMADKFVLKWAAIAAGIKAGLALLKNAWPNRVYLPFNRTATALIWILNPNRSQCRRAITILPQGRVAN